MSDEPDAGVALPIDSGVALPIDGGEASADPQALLRGTEAFPPSPRLRRITRRSSDGSVWTQEYSYDTSGHLVAAPDEWQFAYEGSRLRELAFPGADGTTFRMALRYDGDRFVGTTHSGTSMGEHTLSFSEGRFQASDFTVFFSTGPAVLRVNASYDALGLVSRIAYDASEWPEGVVEATKAYELLYDGATGRIDRVIGAWAPQDPSGSAYRAEVTYDDQGRVAAIRHVVTDRLEQILAFSYNSEGLIGRIEVRDPYAFVDGEPIFHDEPSYVWDLFYEPGTTPTIQFSIGPFLTLRGELTPFVSLTEFNVDVGPNFEMGRSNADVF